jgi:ankyrin repeat protein
MGIGRKNISKIKYFIRRKNLYELKEYIDNNNIVLRLLENSCTKNKVNFLKFSIENDTSVKIIDYIIRECQYETLNSHFNEYGLPLLIAIKHNNYKIADFLIENGANVNFDKGYIIKELLSQSKNDKGSDYKGILYVLCRGFHFKLLSDNINSLIKVNDIQTLEFILKCTSSDINFILDFIEKNQVELPLSLQELKDIFNSMTPDKLEIKDDMYETAIEFKNFEAIILLYHYDKRESNEFLKYIFNLFEKYDTNNNTNTKAEFIQYSIENGQCRFPYDIKIFENIVNIKSLKEDLKEIIQKRDLGELRNFIQEKNIDFESFQSDDFDILMYVMEMKNYPKDILKFIIERYHNLNYSINVKEDSKVIRKSPLVMAIQQENFEIADELLTKEGISLNYFYEDYFQDDFIRKAVNVVSNQDPKTILNYIKNNNHGLINILDYFYEYRFLNKKILNYMLDRGITITKNLICRLLYDKSYKLLSYILRNYIYSNDFILNLLSYSKNRTSLSNKNLNKLIRQENNKIKFNDSFYKIVFYKSKFAGLNILVRYDPRRDTMILNDIFKYVNSNDQLYMREEKINALVRKVQSKKILLKPGMDKYFFDNIINIHDKRERIMKMIQDNDLQGLKSYIMTNNIILTSINDKNNDILIYALKCNASLSIVKYIIQHYSTLNYSYNESDPLLQWMKFISKKNLLHLDQALYDEEDSSRKIISNPLMYALSQNNFKVANLLIKYGANVNYTIHFKELSHSLYSHNYLNTKNLIYILNHGITMVSANFINDIIKDNDDSILNLLYKVLTYDDTFIVKLLHLYKGKVALSNQQLDNIIVQEKYKLEIHLSMFKNAYESMNFDVLQVLLDINNDNFKKIYCNQHDRNSIRNKKSKSSSSKDHEDLSSHCTTYSKRLMNYLTNKNYYNTNTNPKKVYENKDILEYLKSLNSTQNINYLKYGEEILNLIRNGKLSFIKVLVANGLNIYHSHFKRQPLLLAIRTGNIELIKYVMGGCNNTKQVKVSDIIYALPTMSLAVLKLLIKNKILDLNKKSSLLLISEVFNLKDQNKLEFLLDPNESHIKITINILKYIVMYDQLDLFKKIVTPKTMKSSNSNQFILNLKDKYGHSILEYAIENQKADFVQHLLNQCGVDFQNRNYDILTLLNDIRNGKVDPEEISTIKSLILNRVPTTTATNTTITTTTTTPNITNTNNSSNFINTTNMTNTITNSTPNHFEIDDKRNEILIRTIQDGKLYMIHYLIQCGININVVYQKGFLREELLEKNNTRLLEVLVQNHLDINEKDEAGQSLLVYAVQNKNLDIIRNLMESGADIQLVTNEMIYSLINEDEYEILEYLISQNLDINCMDEEGHTPLYYATKNKKRKYCILFENIATLKKIKT